MNTVVINEPWYGPIFRVFKKTVKPIIRETHEKKESLDVDGFYIALREGIDTLKRRGVESAVLQLNEISQTKIQDKNNNETYSCNCNLGTYNNLFPWESMPKEEKKFAEDSKSYSVARLIAGVSDSEGNRIDGLFIANRWYHGQPRFLPKLIPELALKEGFFHFTEFAFLKDKSEIINFLRKEGSPKWKEYMVGEIVDDASYEHVLKRMQISSDRI